MSTASTSQHTAWCADVTHSEPDCVSAPTAVDGVTTWLMGRVGEDPVVYLDADCVPLTPRAVRTLTVRLAGT